MKLVEYLDSLKGKRVAVIGAGISNTPLIEALIEAGIDTTICDKRTREGMGELADRFERNTACLKLGNDYLEKLNADVIFRTPGIMPWNDALWEAAARGAELTSEMEVFFDVCPCKIIAVTGSDGKTTTTTIISELLKKEGLTVHTGGNIGTPLLCQADNMLPNDIVVLELSSFQLITMKKSPDIAVVTNVTPNHLDIHSSLDEYIEAKRSIYLYQKSDGKAVFNLDNDVTRKYSESAQGKVSFFSRSERVRNGVYSDNGKIFESIDGRSEEIISYSDIFLPGTHNIENIMAAFAAVSGLAGRMAMAETAKTFKGVAHRIEFVRELDGVRYYNDSIASSPTRAIAGLRAFDQKVILIAGGKDKGLEFDELGAEIVRHVKTLVLTGLTAEKIRSAVLSAPAYTGAPEIIIRGDFTDAVLTAAQSAGDGDVVILSPACTSFDRFRNFEERGDTFKRIVNELVTRKK